MSRENTEQSDSERFLAVAEELDHFKARLADLQRTSGLGVSVTDHLRNAEGQVGIASDRINHVIGRAVREESCS